MNEVNNSSEQKASLPHMPVPTNQQNHGLQILPLLRSLLPYASGKYCYALATLVPTIVLPAFARSCFADIGKRKSCPSFNPINPGSDNLTFCPLLPEVVLLTWDRNPTRKILPII